MTKADEKTAAIKDAIAANPGISILRLARMLHADYPHWFSTVDIARSAIRFRIGAKGLESRNKITSPHKLKLKKGIGSRTYAMPRSKAEKWEPVHIEGPCTVAVLSDIHFPKHDEQALAAAVAHIKDHADVDILLLNGDIADAEEFGFWAKSPKAIQTESSVDCVRDGLLWLRAEFPNARIIYKYGNHEERLDRYCWQKAPELVGMPHITWEGLLKIDGDLKPVEELAGIEFIGKQRPISLGKLTVFHGHELPKGLVNAVNPARGAFLRMIDTVLIGHHHRSSSHVEYNWRHEPINCWSTGCLCDLTPEYARINKWNHGHAVVDVAASGSFSVSNYKQLEACEVVMA